MTRSWSCSASSGDGEAETGPMAASWQSNRFVDPVRDGAVHPHPAPQRLQDLQPHGPRPHPGTSSWRRCSVGHGYQPLFVEGDDPETDAPAHGRGRWTRRSTPSATSSVGRGRASTDARPRWPMIVLRSPKGWTGPKVVDGLPAEGSFRSHQVPLAEVRENAEAPRAARGVAALLSARGAVRRRRPAGRAHPSTRRPRERCA